MWALFDILRYSASSIVWGILIAILSIALFVFLIKGWYKDATFSPISYLVGTVLFPFLSFQCIMIVGSIKIIDTTDYYEAQISRIVENTFTPTEEVSVQQADDIIKELIQEYPLLRYYICGGEFLGFTAAQLPSAITSELQLFMRWYIFRRLLWSLGFVVVGAILVITSLTRSYKSTRHSERIQRGRIQTERRRVSRRPRR